MLLIYLSIMSYLSELLLICSTISTVICNSGAVRLVNGPDMTSGRVEMCLHEVWGTVCQALWDSTDAGVVCRQLGYSRMSECLLFVCMYNKYLS